MIAGGAGTRHVSDENVAKLKHMLCHENTEEVILIEGNQLIRKIYNNMKLVLKTVRTFQVPSTDDGLAGQSTVCHLYL